MENTLPKNWVETEIGQILISRKGKKPNTISEEKLEESIPYILIEQLEGKSNRLYTTDQNVTVVEKNEVIMVWDGSIGKCGSGFSGALGSTFVSMMPLSKIPTKFLQYIIYSKQNFIKETSTGVGLQHINKNFFKECIIPLPPLAEQERIVTKLDALFAQHEKMKQALDKIPQLLKDFRQQVLTQAVTGKLTEQWREGKEIIIDPEVIKQVIVNENELLNEEQLSNNRSKFKLNPFVVDYSINNWLEFNVESLCTAIVDCLHETAVFSDKGYPILDTNNILAFKINNTKLRYVNDEVFEKWTSRLKPKAGDLVFTREGTIGNSVLIPNDNEYCIGQRTMIFRFTKMIDKKFIEYLFNSDYFKNQYRPLIKGVASQHVNIKDLRLLKVLYPPVEEQKEIVSRVESLFAKADAIEARYQTLKAKIDSLPQAILHKAFKGELVPQLPTDGDAKDLLAEIMQLKEEAKPKKGKKK